MIGHWWIVAIAFSVIHIINTIKRRRQGWKRLGFKELINSLFFLGCIIWIMFAIVFISISSVWVARLVVSDLGRLYSADSWLLSSMPIFYLVSFVILLVIASIKVLKFRPWKYTIEEAAILHDETSRAKARFRNWWKRGRK